MKGTTVPDDLEFLCKMFDPSIPGSFAQELLIKLEGIDNSLAELAETHAKMSPRVAEIAPMLEDLEGKFGEFHSSFASAASDIVGRLRVISEAR